VTEDTQGAEAPSLTAPDLEVVDTRNLKRLQAGFQVRETPSTSSSSIPCTIAVLAYRTGMCKLGTRHHYWIYSQVAL
jgi:hypothetical protein